MTLRSTLLYSATLALAIATLSLAGPSAQAFTFENQGGSNADGSSRFADPDNQVKNFGNGMQLGQGGPFLQFGAQSQQGFGRFNSFGSTPTPPDPYSRPLGNGD